MIVEEAPPMARYRMELTPEEKHRIYLEEKVRFQAKKRIRRETTTRRLRWLMGIGMMCVLITAVLRPERERPRFRPLKEPVDMDADR